MHTELQLILTPEQAEKQELLNKQVADKLKISPHEISRLGIYENQSMHVHIRLK
jgi:hypothetical protein